MRPYHVDGHLDDPYHLSNQSILHVLANLGLEKIAAHYSGRGLSTQDLPGPGLILVRRIQWRRGLNALGTANTWMAKRSKGVFA